MVSPRNETAALGALLAGLRRKLGGQTSTASDETELVSTLEEELEQQRQKEKEVLEASGERKHASEEREPVEDDIRGDTDCSVGVSEIGKGADGVGIVDPVPRRVKMLRRRLCAARVRLEEKAVMAEAIAALDASLRGLRSAVASGAVASFRTLDDSSNSSQVV